MKYTKCCVLIAGLLATSSSPAAVWYVRANAQAGGTGQSWANALNAVDQAINRAQSGDQIWVAAGSYRNSNGPTSFIMRTGVGILGGFAGTETSESQRNPAANITILTGDINGDDDIGGTTNDNALTIIDVPSNTLATAMLDGCTVRSARSQAIRCTGSFTLRNCLITRNNSTSTGCALVATPSLPGTVIRVESCRFFRNGVLSSGSGPVDILGDGYSFTMVNTTFLGNLGGSRGIISAQGVSSSSSFSMVNCQVVQNQVQGEATVVLRPNAGTFGVINCTIAGNVNVTNGASGGISVSSLISPASLLIRNSILWGNTLPSGGTVERAQFSSPSPAPSLDYCRVQGWSGTVYSGIGTSSADPRFVDLNGPDDIFGSGDEDVRLQADSSAIDAGNNFYVARDLLDLDRDGNIDEPTPFDISGGPRFLDEPGVTDTGVGTGPIVDLGAFERGQPIIPCPADFNHDGVTDLFDYLDFVAAFSTGC